MSIQEVPRILLSTTARTNPKGYSQIINYCKVADRSMTEVITDLGDGVKGVRKIYYDIIGANPEKIVDNVAGRCEVYTSAAPERTYGVIQEIEGIKNYLPNLSMEKLAEIL